MFETETEKHCNEAICSNCGHPREGEGNCGVVCHEWRDEYDTFKEGAEFGYNKANEWHKLSEKYPEADKLVRVRLMSGMEHICETCYYEPTEDEIGYGKLVINFYELNGEWVDDNDIIAWCEIPTFTDKE